MGVTFGGANERFYGKDLAETQAMVARHRGPIVFICDDPDLPYLWKTVKKPGQWVAWLNATRPQPFGGQPAAVKCYDAPFASLLDFVEPRAAQSGSLVYLGRPNGRTAAVRKVLASGVPIQFYGRFKEWVGYDVIVAASPTQAERRAFYSRQLGCLALADKKHKQLGWRTGRAYHALHAGCPVVVEADHDALTRAFYAFHYGEELARWHASMLQPEVRLAEWTNQRDRAKTDRAIFEETLRVCGL